MGCLLEFLKNINDEGIVKATLSILLLLSLSTLYVFFMDEPQRWFLFHEEDAEIYARELLGDKAGAKGADRFIDYVVIANKGYVTFYKHGGGTLYGFFPDNEPKNYKVLENKNRWQLLDDHWYYITLE